MLLSLQCSSYAFVQGPSQIKKRTRPETMRPMHLQTIADVLPDTLLSTTFVLPVNNFAATTATAMISDPSVEAEVLNDMAHIGLDLATFLGPATTLLRLATVIGRLCAIGADYLPDQAMLPEEILFQFAMLLVASAGFLQSFAPVLLAATAKPSYRDGRAFRTLFETVGISWLQYKAMAAYALDWVDVEPGVVVTSDEIHEHDSGKGNDNSSSYVYWLYRGDVQVHSNGQSLLNMTQGLLGERNLARLLEKSQKQSDAGSYPKTTIQAGAAGATLLRIHTSKLTMLMKHDQELAQSIRSLLVKGMEDKLTALMTKKTAEV